MKIKITGIIIMVIFAGTLIFYTCGKSQPQTDNQIYIGVACYDQKDTFIEELVDAFKEQFDGIQRLCNKYDDYGRVKLTASTK